MRIVLLSDRIPPENRGGAGRVAWNLARGLCDRGHEVHVIAGTPDRRFEDVREGIPTYHLHARYPARFVAYFAVYNPQTIPHLRRLFEQIRPDVVNAHNVHHDLSYMSLRVAQQMGIPTVFNSHDVMPFAYQRLRHYINPLLCEVTSPDDYRLPRFFNLRQARFRFNPFRNFIIRYILRHHANARISVSQTHRDTLHANGLPLFRVVYNGIDPAVFTLPDADIQAMRARLKLDGRRVMLIAGRPNEDKGGRQLFDALLKVVERLPQAILLILGPQKRIKMLEEARYAPLQEHVRFGGWMEGRDLAAAFNAVDVVTVPSIIMDSFPTVNLEAMAAGKPVVATCHGGSREAVLDGETGFIINPFDTTRYAERLLNILSDDDLRQRMGAAGRRRLLEHFTLAQQVEVMEAIYREVITKMKF